MRTWQTLFTLLIWSPATAQSWCPPGATWWHRCGSGGSVGYVRSWFAGDTVINNITCQRIDAQWNTWSIPNGTSNSYYLSSMLTTVQGDMVMLVHEGVLDTLFHFSGVPGDRWSAPEADHWSYLVADTGVLFINAEPLRWLEVDVQFTHPEGNVAATMFTDTLIERIGFLQHYIRPIHTLSLSPDIHALRCYEDEVLGFSSGIDPSCDHILGMEAHGLLDAMPTLFPNPASVHLSIALPTAIQGDRHIRLRVTDTSGRSVHVWSGTTIGHAIQLRIAHLAQGSYTLLLETGQGRLPATRFVKQ